MNRLANEPGDKTLGVLLFPSVSARQSSYEHPDWQNGAFTKAMLEGLAGAADSEKLGYVETDELAVYVRRRECMTQQLQEPIRMKPDAEREMRLVSLQVAATITCQGCRCFSRRPLRANTCSRGVAFACAASARRPSPGGWQP
jgi:hypothetical protein